MIDKTYALLCVVAGAALWSARADADTEPDEEAPPNLVVAASADGVDRLTLPNGQALLDAFVGVNLASGAVGKPFSLSPDLWYGATDDVTVGLVHSGLGTSGFIGKADTSLCLAGESNGCGKVYPNVGVDVRYKLTTGGFALAANGGLYILAFDPFQLAIKLGIAGRWHSGKLAIELTPNVFLGLTNRSPAPMMVGMMMVTAPANQEVLNLPVTALYSLVPKLLLAVQTGAVLPLENLGDGFAIPLSIGSLLQATDSFSLSVAFSLPFLASGGTQSGFDARTLTIGGAYAF
jgi:hypothetical protein